jgi:hypothetical protein
MLFHGVHVFWFIFAAAILIVAGFFLGRLAFRRFFGKKKDIALTPAEESFMAAAQAKNLNDASKHLKNFSGRMATTVTQMNETIAEQEKLLRKQAKLSAKQKKEKDKKPGSWVKWGWWVFPTALVAILTILKLCGLVEN